MTQSINMNGCSNCGAGSENYTTFKNRGKVYYQYDYRTKDGELFSCVASSLDACRDKRDTWIWLNTKVIEN